MLPVPDSVRRQEQKALEEKQERLAKLRDSGVNLESIPIEELEAGEGEVINSHLIWANKLANYRAKGAEAQAKALEDLFSRLKKWRRETAARLNMAPAAVIPEHVLKAIAYSQPKSVEALKELGVRIVGVEDLSKLINEVCVELGLSDQRSNIQGQQLEDVLIFPNGVWIPQNPWRGHVEKKGRNGKLPAYLEAYEAFAKGKHIETIATARAKPIKPKTVQTYILTALESGRGVDLNRLTNESGTIVTKNQWQKVDEAACLCNAHPEDPGKKIQKQDILRRIIGDAKCDIPFKERSLELKNEMNSWYTAMDFWISLKRVNFPAVFATPTSKRQRTC
eukprot:CAMPEP_0184497644 /NCGR_PEP_ID=MMETSP0113_2-20130426/37074_1 /TAXON_ID=91329 /ORGANISM="Norrisiella sphaerica, Strain BC52" /LENGTH=335 /DNA_ID=CAMNT_0026884845 /DNA_START=542 /DNA_END=1549 /DNA_ORIENTATION=-